MSPIIFSPGTPGQPARPRPKTSRSRRVSSLGVYGQNAFRVNDLQPDKAYWAQLEKRLDGQYIPSVAMDWVRDAVDPFLPDQGHVLDLMCSRYSLLTKKEGLRVHGISLIERSLAMNEALDSFEIRDFNQDPRLPSDRTYQAALMTFGLTYLTQPLEVLQAVRQVLAPKARLIVVCATNCYQLEKAPAIWNNISTHKGTRHGFLDQIDLAKDLMISAGFRIIRAKELEELYYLTYDSFMVVGEKI